MILLYIYIYIYRTYACMHARTISSIYIYIYICMHV
uniref:GBR n=1 Tax=Panax ginseng TaxID=4054 RepID=Q84TC5_PANGI|nr:GBR [Panax ginseng]